MQDSCEDLKPASPAPPVSDPVYRTVKPLLHHLDDYGPEDLGMCALPQRRRICDLAGNGKDASDDGPGDRRRLMGLVCKSG